jgi:hypothetical protein
MAKNLTKQPQNGWFALARFPLKHAATLTPGIWIVKCFWEKLAWSVP